MGAGAGAEDVGADGAGAEDVAGAGGATVGAALAEELAVALADGDAERLALADGDGLADGVAGRTVRLTLVREYQRPPLKLHHASME